MAGLSFNYSKWDNIELSDDESDCHPNIDKASWFRMKHRSRVEREEREEAEKQALETANSKDVKRATELKAKLQAITAAGGDVEGEDPDAIAVELKGLDAAMAQRHARLEELEKNKKWNWENMCHVVEERTIVSADKPGDGKDTMVNSALPAKLQAAIAGQSVAATAAAASKHSAAAAAVPGPTSEEEEIKGYKHFKEHYGELLDTFSTIRDMDATRDFLMKQGGVLFAEHAQNILLMACLDAEMEGKHSRAELVGRQSQILSSITDLAVSARRPPQDLIMPFFRKLEEPVHGKAFLAEVTAFVQRVRNRAVVKKQEAAAAAAAAAAEGGEDVETVELSAEERLGPGGLDPVEVFDTLPESMQKAFESKDIDALKAALAALPGPERAYHMKRCEDSGLWVAGPPSGDGEADHDDANEDSADDVSDAEEGDDAAAASAAAASVA